MNDADGSGDLVFDFRCLQLFGGANVGGVELMTHVQRGL